MLDDKGDLSTIRSVWSEVVENVDRGELLDCKPFLQSF